MSLFPLILPNIELTFKNKTYNLINAKMLYWEVQSTKDIYEQTNGHQMEDVSKLKLRDSRNDVVFINLIIGTT